MALRMSDSHHYAGFTQSGAGECVGMSNPDSWTAVYQALLDDPAHYAILVDSSWTHMGWSKQSAASGATYYTLDFAKASGNRTLQHWNRCSTDWSKSAIRHDRAAPPMATPKPAPNQFQASPARQSRRQQAGFYFPNMPSNQTAPSNMYGGDPNTSITPPPMPDEDAQQMAMLSQYESQIQQLQAQIAALKAQKAGNVF